MRALLPALALFAVLTTAGSGLALIEPVAYAASFAEDQSDATYAYAWGSVDRAAGLGDAADLDLQEQAGTARATAEFLAANAAGQAILTAQLAVAVASEAKVTAEEVAWLEVQAVHGGAEALPLILQACASNPDPVSAVLDCQALVNAWLNAVIAA